MLVEFDSDTNEFIITDTEKIWVPDQVNGEILSLDQKERYRKGKEVELQDGTRLQYTGKEREGVRSNKIALVASIMIDGGLSFALYHGLKAMFGEKHDQKSKEFSKGYDQAVKDMKKQQEEGGPLRRMFLVNPNKIILMIRAIIDKWQQVYGSELTKYLRRYVFTMHLFKSLQLISDNQWV